MELFRHRYCYTESRRTWTSKCQRAFHSTFFSTCTYRHAHYIVHTHILASILVSKISSRDSPEYAAFCFFSYFVNPVYIGAKLQQMKRFSNSLIVILYIKVLHS